MRIRFDPFRADARRELLVLAGAALVLLIRFPIKFFRHPPFLMDFNVYRVAAELVTTGQGAKLYALGFNERMYFKYGPIWAFLWSPLAYLSTFHGGVLWSVISVAWLLVTLWATGRLLREIGFPAPWWMAIAALLVLVRPLLGEFNNGQADLWWGGLVTLFILFEVRNARWPAALCLALSILLKLPSAIFLPYLVFAGRPAAAMRALLCLAGLAWAGAFAVDPAGPNALLADWLSRLTVMGPKYAFEIGDQSLLALLGRFLTDDGYRLNVLALPRSAVLPVCLAVDALLFLLVVAPWAPRARTPARFACEAAMLIALMVLASPSAWLATYVVCLTSVAIAGTLLVRLWPSAGWTAAALALVTCVLSLFTKSGAWRAIGLPTWRTESYVFLVFMVMPWLALALFFLLVRLRQPLLARPPAAAPHPATPPPQRRATSAGRATR